MYSKKHWPALGTLEKAKTKYWMHACMHIAITLILPFVQVEPWKVITLSGTTAWIPSKLYGLLEKTVYSVTVL